MFRIKICGVRQVEEVEAVMAAGGDAVGLNFVPASPRCLTPAQAARLCEAAASIDRVGVFVNAAVDEIAHTAETAPLSHIQLHGEESDGLLQALPPQQVIRAWRVRGSEMEQIEQWLQQNIRQGWRPAALLLDAYAPNAHGGTGLTLDWQAIELEQGLLLGVPVILAGGLTPDNVGEAIRLTRPSGVDVASGVERAPGEKDLRRVRAFIREARAAFEEIAAVGR